MSDDQLLQVFIEEANDILTDLDTNLIELEDNPHDQDLINQIFRSFHTLKGSASLTGLTKIADFVHHAEDLLDRVRNGELEINSDIINLLLKVHDLVEDMVKEVTTSGFEVDNGEVEEVESSLKYFLDHDTPSQIGTQDEASEIEGEQIYKIKLKFNQELFATGTDPIMLLEELAELGEVIDSNINLTKVPEIYNLDPEKCHLNITVMLKTEEPQEEIEEVFVFVEFDNEIEITNVTDHFSDDLDVSLADKLTGEILVERGIVDEEDIEEALSQQHKLGDLLEKSGKVSKEQVNKVVQEQQKSKEVKEKSTIKVDTDKLEDLMNSMAELVISQSKVRELIKNKADLSSNIEIDNALDEVDKKVRGLQEEVMNTRMIPIGSTFMRFKRLVRDLSQEQGKEINLKIKGKETELDKTVIEEIGDPLKHMIRNSIDHGIEMPDEREMQGKSRTGTITLNAYHKEGKVVIEIKDDGRGLNKDKILEKAQENGLVEPDEELKDREIYQLIMEPGFSTSEEITETSGRGVGMDVVKSNIEKLRGSVKISSEEGEGTTFKLKLPLTLAIIDGMKVKIGDEYFIIPLNSIVEFIQPFARQLKTVEGKGEVVKIRDKYVILSRLSNLLDVEADVSDPTEGIVIIVHDEGREICLLVDEILGQQQAVIKSLEDNYTYVEGLSGAAILGDGNVAMILDIATIINMAFR
ncbi:chemotaxis protein CheA [Halanaerobacter jeridensis]|uniref:Chemotaxis protein CheA n=1 Tax=Halanaerobacter jeridensis TaxID=706427 RepID=A0A938XVC4_9FIRM|nr:chemotaxis protein CheA [Halanaerobacter jeridensis]MBM7555915.1 two-component system chemotaxis sensor kinase CheA [Halanaerobacter jeridensis]